MRTVALLGVMAAAGCASHGNREIADEARVSKIEKGKSTKANVETLVGKPTKVDFTDGGMEKWIYEYSQASVRGTSFIPVVGIFAGGTNTETDTLTVLFSKDGIVENVGRGHAVGGGGGLQDAGGSSGLPPEPKPERPTTPPSPPDGGGGFY